MLERPGGALDVSSMSWALDGMWLGDEDPWGLQLVKGDKKTRLEGCIRTRLQLPIAFAKLMREEKPPMLHLQVHGCGNGTVPVTVEQPGPRLLFLGRGWKTFVSTHNLWDGHALHFKMMADNLLSVKIYWNSGVCLGYGEKRSCGTGNPSSSESDEDGSDGSDSVYGSDPR
ncbi:l-ascorbate oxidase-like protein [Hordeum vulgare]|nr:l-ascorbate oxidase-like protein [Hordeum vulgare]